jgi:hypothetical protein
MGDFWLRAAVWAAMFAAADALVARSREPLCHGTTGDARVER